MFVNTPKVQLCPLVKLKIKMKYEEVLRVRECVLVCVGMCGRMCVRARARVCVCDEFKLND
jgi:hypothetical protein